MKAERAKRFGRPARHPRVVAEYPRGIQTGGTPPFSNPLRPFSSLRTHPAEHVCDVSHPASLGEKFARSRCFPQPLVRHRREGSDLLVAIARIPRVRSLLSP